MEDNKNLENTQQNEEQREISQEEKTFTQDEVNEIVKKRLERERKKQETAQEDESIQSDREKDLEVRENAIYIKERFAEVEFPEELMELVSGKSKEEIDKTIEILKPYMDRLQEPIFNPVYLGNGSGAGYGVDAIRTAMGLSRER